MLICENLSYKNRFKGLGFSLIPGALLAVYGEDATGLIMLLAQKLKPTGGRITFEDVPISRSKGYRELSVYIPNTTPTLSSSLREGQRQTRQSSQINFLSLPQDWIASLTMFTRNDASNATVEQTVTRLARTGGGGKELTEAALRYFGLSGFRTHKTSTLSPALQKRILLTQLLTLPRPIWLLDHPEQGLDAEGLGMLDALIANRCNQHGIVIIATRREGFMNPLPALFMRDFAQ